MGVVISHAEGYTTIPALLGGFAFHAICMGLGAYFIGRTVPSQRPEARPTPVQQ